MANAAEPKKDQQAEPDAEPATGRPVGAPMRTQPFPPLPTRQAWDADKGRYVPAPEK